MSRLKLIAGVSAAGVRAASVRQIRLKITSERCMK
jgi:hypothetical protein